ncbi:glutamate-5-semialdehyde dehydrogenase [Hymenobacter taeanensis]|uniref:Gamma-glutamyl phosphate reductase n=1 Tax=Hymenobacter taeanensis TaxID=2735321 RepID=A0A6M6BFX7_9BACT|nr:MULTISPECIES: glutamate-5-semialdehyde dehydrogenase [Hymenobacter]QJX47441.1 glutamate-5-semialdehyde dehydrogenase [Hymenobacter taeanensis]UOQ83077.1 glutamate-5-semialdehyde dehydrogenase [Hymenobacter sp. 5414T-23]
MHLQDTFRATQHASRALGQVSAESMRTVLLDLAAAAVAETPFLLAENEKDLARMSPDDPKYDRLQLTAARIASIAEDIRNVAGLPSPLGQVLQHQTLPNGLDLSKVRVPLGVVGVIYEARPNVTFDVAALCLKTGNACLLKGGSDAAHSNLAISTVIQRVLGHHGLNAKSVTLLPPDRQATEALLQAIGYVDVLIPRGSQQLIDYVRQHAKVPVIETGAGIVHTYFDETADLAKGQAIIVNAKTRRVSVCNALDCLLVHEARIADLPELLAPLGQSGVLVYADTQAYEALTNNYPAELLQPATEEHFGTEFLSLKLAIKTVTGLEEALGHIAVHSSKHSEAIISENAAHIEQFLNQVDAAAVYANASTAFTDGAQFGLGAEIGISTQKLHARGPMALEELTSYKWQVRGNGQVR